MRRMCFVGILLAIMATVGISARKEQYRSYGAGLQSCGKWVEDRRTKDEIGWMMRGQWVLGWISAAGYYGQTVKKTDSDAITAWIDNYCAANPLDDIDTAAKRLVDALSVKQPQ